MSEYYRGRRTRNIYNPKDKEPFRLSRSKLELFLNCPRCFYIDRRLGVDRPPGYPFTINSAIDRQLKKEFDIHRMNGNQHPLMKAYGIDAVPAKHEKLDQWRDNFRGLEYFHKSTNLVITGAIDDLWQNSKGEYIVVDYKATSVQGKITELNKDWHDSYKRQMEIYQWLLRKHVARVSDVGYFVYANGRTDLEAFDGKIEFDVTLIAYEGDDRWVEKVILSAYDCLQKNEIPVSNPDCDYCIYVNDVGAVTNK